jgi:hypothetical protein
MKALLPLAFIVVGVALLLGAGHLRRRHFIYMAVAVLTAAVLYPLLSETIGPDGAVWHAATFFGSILVTIGWVVTSETAIRSSKRQHTITLITQHAFDPKRGENRDIIKRYLPTYQTRLTPQIADFSDETHPLLKAIDLELNFYEFLAVGAHRDDLDERLLRESLYGQFSNFYRQNIDYIKYWQAIGEGSTWSHMTKMYVRWSQKPAPKAT